MSRIVCGRFDRTVDADAALDALKRGGFARNEVDAFYVGPPGQNAMEPLGGDAPHSSEGSRHAGVGAAIGAFAGAMSTLRGGRRSAASIEHPVESRGGRMIAVCVERSGTERLAIEALRANQARDLGVTQGGWRDGSWRDFDPRRPLATV
jgi:hypothetical protein